MSKALIIVAPLWKSGGYTGFALSFCQSVILSFCNLSDENFRHTFLRNCEAWNLVHSWTVGRCIMCTVIRLLLLIHPFISSFFFLCNFQTLKFFVTLFSGTVRPKRLKLGTHMDSGQMYSVFWNQAVAAYLSLCFSLFFLSNFQTLKFFIILFSGTVRPRRLKLVTHVDSGQMYSVFWNQAVAAYLSLCFSLFFLSNFQTLKFFIILFFQELWGLEGWNLLHMWTMGGCIMCTRIMLLLLFVPLFFHFSFSPIFKH